MSDLPVQWYSFPKFFGTCDQKKYEGYGLGHLHSALKHLRHQDLQSDSLSSPPPPFSHPAFTLNATLEICTRNQYKLRLCPSFSSHHLPVLLIQLCFLSRLSPPSSSTVATIIISLLKGCNRFPKELSCLLSLVFLLHLPLSGLSFYHTG